MEESLCESLVKYDIICLNSQPPWGVLKSSRQDELLNKWNMWTPVWPHQGLRASQGSALSYPRRRCGIFSCTQAKGDQGPAGNSVGRGYRKQALEVCVHVFPLDA